MRIVYQNIVFALAVKALCLILSALGITNMWWGVFADVGVMILAVLVWRARIDGESKPDWTVPFFVPAPPPAPVLG